MDSEEQETTETGTPVDETFQAAAAQARQDPSDDAAWDALEDFAASSQRPDEVGALYREVLQGPLPDGVASSLSERVVQFHEEWFREDSPQLIEALRCVLRVDEGSADWAFQRLTVLCRPSLLHI